MRDDLTGARLRGRAGVAPPPLAALMKSRVAAAVMGFAILGALGAAPAQAHGRLGAAQGHCRLFVGPDTMNFTGYLPEASKNEFCEDIPSTGPMIMVLDAEQDELRDMAVEIRIVKDVGEAQETENLEATTVAYAPPKHYRTGTINFEHNFPEAGYFVGIVTVTGDHGERWVSRFPFSVGMTFMRDLPVYATLVLGVIAAFAIYLYHFLRKPPAKIATAAAAFRPPPPFDPRPPSPTNDEPAPVEAKAKEEEEKASDGKEADDDSDTDDHYKRQAAE